MNLDYGDCWGGKVSGGNMLEPLSELDDGTCGGGLEPLQRARSNTWPLPRPDDYVDGPPTVGGGGGNGAVACNNMLASNKCLGPPPPPTCAAAAAAAAAAKKNSSRRNAWGNFSYADLITQAITSSPDKRLTLSQIYEWMVQNVDYFKDKGDSNSSAGWKNSIRHNLSLHNRFMRVQNEGTGKSSWWMINPDAKPGKSVRRRAASMETSKFEKRRGRVKKKILEMRSGLTEATPSPSSSVSEGLDMFPDSPLPSAAGFQLSPDFRPRTSSTTSSCGGRLSPIRSVDVESDWGSAVTGGPPFSTSSGYSPVQSSELVGNGGNGNNGGNGKSGSYSPDQLAGNLEHGMKLEPNWGYMNGQGPPPPYNYDGYNSGRDMSTSLHASSPFGLPQCPIHRLQNCGCAPVQCKVEQMSPGDMSPSYPQSEPSPDPLGSTQYLLNQQQPPQHNSMPRPPSSSPPLTPPQQQQQQQQQVVVPSTVLPATLPTVVTTVQGVNSSVNMLTSAINSSMMPFGCDDDLVNIESLQGGFDCNVDELIKHELNMDGSLDFNFPPSGGAISAAAAAAAHAAAQQQQHHQHMNNHVVGLNHLQHSGHSQHHSHHHHHHSGGTTTVLGGDGVGVGVGAMMVNSAGPGAPPQPPPAYSAASVTTPSWVH